MNWQEIVLWWPIAAGVFFLAVTMVILRAWLRRHRHTAPEDDSHLRIAVDQLDSSGPPVDGPRLEFYGTPVRLAIVVVAPGGRGGELPSPDLLPAIMERLVPGLPDVITAHHPIISRWPTQLSSQGFAQSFQNRVALPGTRGQGTPWCSIAGKLSVGERLMLVGLVLCADAPNGLSQVTVQHEGQWMDILRIRDK